MHTKTNHSTHRSRLRTVTGLQAVMDKSDFAFHTESTASVAASPQRLFAYLDDHSRLSSHMSKSSWMMAGSSMNISTDREHGQAIGSRISLSGKVLGIALNVDERVTERDPPTRKTWATVGVPRLLVIGSYRMGFEISVQGVDSRLRVWIDYALPDSGGGWWLGRLFSGMYARWCTASMATDAAKHFRPPNP